jgi:hypothetical protein
VYVTFLWIDISGLSLSIPISFVGTIGLSSILKFASIILCLVIATTIRKSPSNLRDANLQVIIFFWTLAADFFLLFTSQFVVGITIFCGAHLTAILRYRRKLFRPALIFFFVAWLVWFAFSYARTSQTPFGAIYFVSIIYAILIITSTVTAFISDQPKKNRWLSSTGMILFLLCDLNVALANVLPEGNAIWFMAEILMWAFYLPAQTLLSLSAYSFVTTKTLRQIRPVWNLLSHSPSSRTKSTLR